jgi:hypothetical protein
MPAAIRQLSDDDLEAVRHLIRRGAVSQVQIAQEISRRLGRPLAGSDAAGQRMVSRYAKGRDYARWLQRWEGQNSDLRKSVETGRQKYEFLMALLKDSGTGAGADGMDLASRAIQGRILAEAMEMSDEELLAGLGARGPIANMIRLVQNERLIALRESLTGKAAEAGEIAADNARSPAERRAAIRAIFGTDQTTTKGE